MQYPSATRGLSHAYVFFGINGIYNGRSGLKEAFCVIYAENSAAKALLGHVDSRAVRGHFLIQIVLATLIFESTELGEVEKTSLMRS